MSASHEKIQELAYRLWQDDGAPEGRAMDYWLQAEAALHTTIAAAPKVTAKPKAEKAPAKPKAAAKPKTAAKPKAAKAPAKPKA